MSITRNIAKKLTQFPHMKRAMKNAYMQMGNILSDKRTDIPGLVRVSSDQSEHNFGYYDKSPWSSDGKYMVYLAPQKADKCYVSKELTSIILYDCETKQEKVIANTHVWNSQQGCMLQWLGPDHKSQVLFNDFREGRYCSVIHSLEDDSEKVLKLPVYTVSSDGKTAITLDFSRLNTFRPGYGYCNLTDDTANDKYPDITCMWRLDIDKDEVFPLPITYRSLAEWEPQEAMKSGFHKVNHLMLNPSADRFMFIHRWIVNGVTHHRLLTCDVDGRNLYTLLDDGMVSHNNWKNDTTIISYCFSEKDGDGYHILHDKTQQRELIGEGILTVDGHPSYSPDGKYIVTDTYPDFKGKQTLYLIRVRDGKIKKLGSIYSDIRYRNEVRCDLHPRWSYDSTMICIDAAPEKKRQVYIIPIGSSYKSEKRG